MVSKLLLRAAPCLLLCLPTLVLVSCGPPPRPSVGHDSPPAKTATPEDPNVDVKKARAYILKARAVLEEDKHLAAPRQILAQAEPFANDTVREEIRRLRQHIDSLEADREIPAVLSLAKSGQCIDAANKVAAIAKRRRGSVVPRFVRDKTSKQTLDCLLGALDIDVSIGRELADSLALKKALAPDHFQQLQSKVADATVGTIIKQLDEPLQKRRWAKVVKQLDELVARMVAGKLDVRKVMSLVRAGVSEDIEKKVADKLANSSGVGAALREVDKLIEAARWKTSSVHKGEQLPAAIVTRRRQLAFWALCTSLGCKQVSARQSWAYGHAEVRPLLDTKGKPLATIKHAGVAWRIAESSGWVLVAQKDPGAVEGPEALLAAAQGWVLSARLRKKDTAEMLPPGDAIVGTRVWGPLRKGQSTWELGRVTAVKKGQLEIERLADRQKVTLARGKVRFGTIRPDTKVLANCSRGLVTSPAMIDKVVGGGRGDPVAKLSCLDDKGERNAVKRQAQLGSLRTRPSWLPSRR